MNNNIFACCNIIRFFINLFLCIFIITTPTITIALNYIDTELTKGGSNEVVLSSDGKYLYSAEMLPSNGIRRMVF
jgi:hypothetical protein